MLQRSVWFRLAGACLPLLVAILGVAANAVVALGVALLSTGVLLWSLFGAAVPNQSDDPAFGVDPAPQVPPACDPAPDPPAADPPPSAAADPAKPADQPTLQELERFKAVSRIASQVAHHLNNALCPVLGYAEILLHGGPDHATPEARREALSIMRSCTLDATNQVRRLEDAAHAAETGANQSSALDYQTYAAQFAGNNGLRILVVDDDKAVRDVIRHVLVADGHRVDTAADPRQAVELFRHVPFEFVLVDGAVADYAGQPIADILHGIRPSAQVAIMAGACGPGGPGSDRELVLRKPIALEDLREFVANVKRRLEADRNQP